MPRKTRIAKELDEKKAAAAATFREYATEVGRVAFDFPWAQAEAIGALQALVRLAERIQAPAQAVGSSPSLDVPTETEKV